MGAFLKGINKDKRKYDTSLNRWKLPLSLEEACKPAAVSTVANHIYGSECNNGIVTEMDESIYGSVKTSSPSGMWGLMWKFFIFSFEYIISDVDYDYSWCGL